MIRRILAMTPKTTLGKTKLGRWEHQQTQQQLEIKLTWANADHCGDSICGRPEQIKQNTELCYHQDSNPHTIHSDSKKT